LEIDPELGEAYTPLGAVSFQYHHDWVAAADFFEKSIELSPSFIYARTSYISFLQAVGRVDDALVAVRLALDVDPVSLYTNSLLASTFTWMHLYDKAIEQFHRTIELDPKFAHSRILLAEAYLAKGMYDEAISEYQKTLKIAGDMTYAIGGLGLAYGFAGREAEALEQLNRLNEMSAERHVSGMHKAFIYLGLGQADKMLDHLEDAYQVREGQIVWLRHPLFEPYRSNPRFFDLLKRIGLED